MTTFDDREKGFEAKYKRDQETQFKVVARRNKLLGLWAAEQLGKAGAEAEAYAKEVVIADLDKPGDDDVIGKVVGDFQAAGIAQDADAVRRKLLKLAEQARQEIERES